jgi:hypothetical protein
MVTSVFSSYVSGPPPGGATTGSNQWIDLGPIPTGLRVWFGNGSYLSPDKSITFEVRTNNIGSSAGSDAATTLVASTSVSPRSGAVVSDYYRKGRLHLTSVYSTGVEHFWLHLKSKSGSAGSYLYTINYTTE